SRTWSICASVVLGRKTMIMVFSIFQITVGKSQNSKNKNQTNSKNKIQNTKPIIPNESGFLNLFVFCLLSFVILAADQCHGKGPQHRQLFAAGFQGGEGLLDLRVFDVSLEIHKKDILRLGQLGGERFDPGQVELVALEDLQGIHKRTRMMG